MTSTEREKINEVWRRLGVDYRSDDAREIELRIQRATLQEIADGFTKLAVEYLSKRK